MHSTHVLVVKDSEVQMSEFHIVLVLECGLLYQIQHAIVSKIYWYFVSGFLTLVNVLMLASCVSVYTCYNNNVK